MYLAVPVFLYASERTLRLFRSGFYTVHLIKVGIESETIKYQLDLQKSFSTTLGMFFLTDYEIGFRYMLCIHLVGLG